MLKNNFTKFFSVLFLSIALLSVSAVAQMKNAKLSFETAVAYGKQQNNLTILVSNDFNGNYELEDIKKAKWVDITSSFALAYDKELEKSGSADLDKYIKKDKPLYIAFKYTGQATAKSSQRSWSVDNVVIKSKGADKSFSFPDFNIVQGPDNGDGVGFTKSSDTGIRYLAKGSTNETQSWAILKATD